MQRAPKPEFDSAKADRDGKPRVRPPRTTVADRQGLPRGSVRAPVKTAAKEVQESRPDRTKQANIAEQKVGDRLAKRLAAQANCSRSQAEQYIEGGWVRVDGQLIESVGARVLAHQTIELDKNASLEALEEITILMHKPVGFDSGEGGNPALLLLDPAKQSIDPNLAGGASASTRFLQRHFTNLTPTTPLPFEASGLIVFTQDFRIARKLNDDADRVEQECMVQVDAKRALQGPLTEDVIYQALDRLCHGLSFNGIPLPPIKVSIAQHTDKELWLRFAFKGIRPGQIPQMVERVGLRLLAIKRIRIGRIPMGDLAVGEWRYLPVYKRF
ncbi:MAG: RNA pseudouridine synthase [Burkholderiaceae bacterium]